MAPEMGPLGPGARLGILGGGQLGRMIALAAARLGVKCHVFAPEGEAPACDVAAAATRAPYTDEDALARFAEQVDAVTIEFENVPVETAAFLEPRTRFAPSADALAVAQDRVAEKSFVNGLSLQTALFAPVSTTADLDGALKRLGLPAILKTRRLGYDGKGQARIKSAESGHAAFAAIGEAPAILEAFVPFVAEASVIVCRGWDGAHVAYDVARNLHAGGILRESVVPSGLSRTTEEAARAAAFRIADALGFVGTLTVELFITAEGDVLVNEIAPRVHNSGHWTIDAAETSQFENHVRAVLGWPLGSTRRTGDVVMRNLLGAEAAEWRALAAREGARLHLYGKEEMATGRKMGHVTEVRPRQM
ncbi:MAG: 5-(carboxyamino)imidazole ribonucleotide synthase [Alphaproteobacteria bacterium]|nr:5-(carboxyamino)imidazole ribonucleotide synthase [Alphaproteobacteria bacterium]